MQKIKNYVSVEAVHTHTHTHTHTDGLEKTKKYIEKRQLNL